MTAYKVVARGSSVAACACVEAPPAPDPCWHPPPSCARYPPRLLMPVDLVDPECLNADRCGTSVCAPFWYGPYWWPP